MELVASASCDKSHKRRNTNACQAEFSNIYFDNVRKQKQLYSKTKNKMSKENNWSVELVKNYAMTKNIFIHYHEL